MKKIKIIFCGIFIVFIFVVGIGTLDNNKASSSDEMRTFTKFPDLDIGSLISTDYLDTISTAANDQLEWRANFVKSYFSFNKDILNQTFIGNVVIGKDQVLFNAPINVKDWEEYKANIIKGCEQINEVAKVAKENGTKLIVIDVPRKDIAMQDYVPSYYPDNSKEYLEYLEIQKENLSQDVSVIDVYTLFKENKREDGQIYFYYNDHHINALGNELILTEIMKVVNEDYPQIEQYTLDKYNATYKQVYGSLNRKIGLSATAPDEILSLESNGWDIQYTRTNNGVPTDEPILNMDADAYSTTYMGGNYGETVVSTNREELPSIFLCGSSFTNGLESLSVPSFNNMYSVDFRYNETENNIMDYIVQWKPEYVVLISAQSTATFKYNHLITHLGTDKNVAEYD